MRILLVDDDVFLRNMYATKFKEHGDDVMTAESGEQALQLVATDVFDAIITDMVMPSMSGLELLTALKTVENAKNAKCIVLSNQGEDEDMTSAYALGAIGYIIKAASIPSEVVTKVHSLVS